MSAWLLPLWWANGLGVLALLLTYLAPHADPGRWWPLAILAMAYPYQLLVHAGFIAGWLLLRPRRALFSLVAVLIGWSHVGDHYQLFGRTSPPKADTGTPFTLLSWNVHLFDLYNWSGNKVTRDSMFRVLHREDADVLCTQEYFTSTNPKYFATGQSLRKEFRYKHVHEVFNKRTRFQQTFGIATFSAHPIADRGHILFPANPDNLCIWSDIVVGDDTVRIYNAHLASYHFGDRELDFIASLDTLSDRDEIRRGGLRILRLLRRGFRLRADEVRRIADHMAESPHPVVFCGDINDVPMSHAYHRLRKGRLDAFRESGRGTGGTYIGKLPSFRIDHILHDPELVSWDFRTLPEELSDHRALACSLAVRR
jgi:endonuclease/exonuclease/phosphatase family metal-dependent hydrolase